MKQKNKNQNQNQKTIDFNWYYSDAEDDIQKLKLFQSDNEAGYNLLLELESNIDSMNDEYESLEKELKDSEDENNSLQEQIDDLESSLDFLDGDLPETYNEKEIFEFCLSVYKNRNRLSTSDLEILKLLSNKSL